MIESDIVSDVTQLQKSHDIITKQLFELQKQIIELTYKETRYDALQDRYLNQNQKHFDELCGTYFDDYPLKIKEEYNNND